MTNHLGHFYLTILLMPSLLRSNSSSNDNNLPRVINLSSTAHRLANDYEWLLNLFDYCIENKNFMSDKSNEYHPWINYGISKTCNILFARELQKRYNNKLIAVSAHPGGVKTGLSRHINIQSGLYILTSFMMSPFRAIKNLKTIPQGSATTLRCVSLLDNQIKKGHYYFNCRSGRDENEIEGVSKIDLEIDGDKNGLLARKLWTLSEVLIKSKGHTLN